MASPKERKKEVYCEINHIQNVNMKRGKPQQAIYRPGSGPLRKSGHGIEETESDTNVVFSSRQSQAAKCTAIERPSRFKSAGSSPRENTVVDVPTDKLGDMSIADNKRKSKKPEQTFYVPRALAQARESHANDNSAGHTSDEHFSHQGGGKNINKQVNGNDNIMSSSDGPHINAARSKRYSNRRRSEASEGHEEWRTISNHSTRNLRQGSEPRAMSNQNSNSYNRVRDTRSVEPIVLATSRAYMSDKINSKPPSGRRHSTIGVEPEKRPKNLDSLPPRLKKKFLEDGKLGGNYVKNEEQWDGSSITFQGSQGHHGHHSYTPKQSNQNYSTLPSGIHHHMHNQHIHQNNLNYYTLPSNRPRGRGRLQQDYENKIGMYRSITPEKIFMISQFDCRHPASSTFTGQAHSLENLQRVDSRSQTPVHMYSANDDYKLKEDGRRSVDRFNDDRLYSDKISNEDRNSNFNKIKCRNNRPNRNNRDRNFNQNDASKNVQEKFDVTERSKTPRKFRDSLEAQLSPVSPPTPPEKEIKSIVPINNTILDWSEEVELNDKLETEVLSDALTRSSSIASLMETSIKSLPPSTVSKKSKKRKSRNSQKRSGSKNRDKSTDTQSSIIHRQLSQQQSKHQNREETQNRSREQNRTHQNSGSSLDSRDNFKIPDSRRHRDKREHSFDRRNKTSRNTSRESSFDRTRRSSCSEHENWRDEIRSRQNSERELSKECEVKEVKKGGIIVLPQSVQEQSKMGTNERPKYPDIHRKVLNPGQKSLYDPNNPNKPIIVKPHSSSSRVSVPGFSDNTETPPPQLYTTDQFGNVRPAWYDEYSDRWKQCHYPDLLRDIIRADNELQYIISSGHILLNWGSVATYRSFLMQSLEYLLSKDMKFCQSENIEQHFWKILFYNIIEMMRKAIINDPTNREQYKGFVLFLIDEGTKYFELLLERMEETHKFKISDYLSNQTPQKGKYFGLVLISAQKIFLFLGDLLRYREQVNETSNYGKCRQWYIKAHEINPKNGRPYNQLALLAVYARRKLDAVYYYMRSLMSSNPVQSARESLISLFDENRKKYEQGERKRREERLERARQNMKEKESEAPAGHPNSLRREIWIHPDGGRRVHRTTSAVQEPYQLDSEEEDLATLTSVEVNKRFVTSYLHVHGKLITKIGMETFHETALQMLKEFRALLQHSPVPLPCNRFLQLLALNMFAIESTQLKDPELQSQSGYRSELQERALVVSLQMFSLILERCVSLLQEQLKSKFEQHNPLPQDVHVLLPAVKIWCDWLLCHSSVWNPPPSTQDYKVGAPGDAWNRMASLMNLLEKLDQSASSAFVNGTYEGYEQVRLPEDGVLSGFTPLMLNVQDPTYVPKDFDMEAAQFALRLNKLLFFGTVFLCGLEPPVLKLELENDYSVYVSVVRTSSSRSSPPSPPELNNEDELLVESFSEDENETGKDKLVNNAPSEIRDLLTRKVELEKRHRHQEIHRQRVQKILQQSVVSVHIEVRPKYLIPDTNCFIDYLDLIKTIASVHVYTLMVPLVVLNELEGLAKGGKSPAPTPKGTLNPEHIVRVAESAKHALEFLSVKNSSVKCITTKGTILTSSTFTIEDDSASDSALKNDDKILSSCLALCKGNKDQQVEGEPRKLYREVVLLTEDRNLRVKALARDVPVRELPDFKQWAGLG